MKRIFIIAALAVIGFGLANAQSLRTAYFLENSMLNNSLNPAFQPYRGYVSIPLAGSTDIAYSSNSLSLDKILYPNESGSGLVTFMDEQVDATEFLKNLKTDNRMDLDLGMKILGFGFHSGKSFWTFDIDLKNNVNLDLPREFFEFAKIGSGESGMTYNMKDFGANVSSYASVGVGYSRTINERLSVGAKMKVIAGAANVDMRYSKMDVVMRSDKWEIDAVGELEASCAGLTFEDDDQGCIDFENNDFSLKKPAGWGAAIDLGASYKLLDDRLTLSAAVIDLGFIKWGAENTTSGTAQAKYYFAGFNVNKDGTESSLEGDFEDFTKFKRVSPQSNSTGLRTTINVGGEFEFVKNVISAGLLSSTQFRPNKTFTELTAAGTVRLKEILAASVSCSLVNGQYATVGFAVNFSPSWINLFIGTDNILGKVSKQFIPISQRSANLYVGLGIPLGRKWTDRQKSE